MSATSVHQSIEREGDGYRLHQEQFVNNDLGETFEFFSDPHNLEPLTPNRLNFNILGYKPDPITEGTEIDYTLTIWGCPINWRSKITDWNPPNQFRDVMVKGPYETWNHEHRFKSKGSKTLIIDDVYYELPFGSLGRLAGGWLVKWDLSSIFRHRADRMDDLL